MLLRSFGLVYHHRVGPKSCQSLISSLLDSGTTSFPIPERFVHTCRLQSSASFHQLQPISLNKRFVECGLLGPQQSNVGRPKPDDDQIKRYRRECWNNDDRGVINSLSRETKAYCNCMKDKKSEANGMEKLERCLACQHSFPRAGMTNTGRNTERPGRKFNIHYKSNTHKELFVN